MKAFKPPAPPRPAYGYARVSTRAQAADGLSLETQEEAIRAYARDRGLHLMRIFVDEGKSAKSVKSRPAFQRLLALVESGEVGAIIVTKLSRFSRSLLDLLQTVQVLKDHGVAFISIGDPHLQGPIGDFVLGVLGSAAQFERDLTAERTREVLRARKRIRKADSPLTEYRLENGKLAVGRPPYGYRYVRGSLVPLPREMEAVNHIRQQHREGRTIAAIIADLHERGHLPRRGGAWQPTQVRRIIHAEYY